MECKSVGWYAGECKSMRGSVRMCKDVQRSVSLLDCATECKNMQGSECVRVSDGVCVSDGVLE